MQENKQEEFYIEGIKHLNMKMIYVEGGTFTMGADEEDIYAYDDEKPSHQVSVDSYFIGAYPVTQSQWRTVMGNNPSEFKNSDEEDLPVESINWYEAQEFCQKLSALTGKKYMLPTEAQWEFAVRGGNKGKGTLYSGSNNIDEVAWYKNNSNGTGHSVANKTANELGLYDMSGNYGEVCNDKEDDEYYIDGRVSGGCWNDKASDCKVSSWKSGSTSASKIPGTNLKELNAFDSKYITVRLVYSVPK